MYVVFVKTKFGCCSNASIMSRMVLPVMVASATDARIFCISDSDKLVALNLCLLCVLRLCLDSLLVLSLLLCGFLCLCFFHVSNGAIERANDMVIVSRLKLDLAGLAVSRLNHGETYLDLAAQSPRLPLVCKRPQLTRRIPPCSFSALPRFARMTGRICIASRLGPS
jgi:hypothetical protein